ncbi:MAG: EthD domain-containing protein [Xanthobacteraceae bacterium]
MIKIAELLVRKSGMSRAEFQDYWRRVHGPLVMSITEIRRHVAKYVQSHTLPYWYPFLAGEGPLYDGIAEVWCDGIEAAQRMFAEPKFQELVSPDEKKFLEVTQTVILAVTEHTIYQRTSASIHGGVKLFEMPARRREMSRPECHRYWRDTHAPLVMGTTEMVKPLRRYVQAHCLEDGAAGLPPMRYDGLAELWFDSVDDLQACFGRQYLDVVHPDEPKFVDPEGSSALIAEEHIIYERA